jgi:hypothetical protein
MVGLGLKLEELLKQKGLENKSKGGKVNRYEAIKQQEDKQISAQLPDYKKDRKSKKRKYFRGILQKHRRLIVQLIQKKKLIEFIFKV